MASIADKAFHLVPSVNSPMHEKGNNYQYANQFTLGAQGDKYAGQNISFIQINTNSCQHKSKHVNIKQGSPE